MSDAPKYKHVYLSETASINHRPPKRRHDERRYTCTEGPEWDALMERANFMLGHVHPESGEAHILRDLLAYLGEQP